MKVSSEELHAAAGDARLSISSGEAETIRLRFQELMAQVLEMKGLFALENTPPLSYPHEIRNTWRDDHRASSLSREEALANGPDTDSSCFHVPRIVEG